MIKENYIFTMLAITDKFKICSLMNLLEIIKLKAHIFGEI